MAQKTINPYPDLGIQFQAGLNAIIGGLPPTPTIDQLVTQVYNYVVSVYYSSVTPAQTVEIKSVAYSAIDSYVDGLLRNPATNLYNSKQTSIIKMLAGPPLTSFLTVDEVSNRISNIEDNLTLCGLSVENQTPLFFATMIGVNSYNYWLAQIALGVGSAWVSHFNTAKVSAMGNVPFWTAAAMEGALIGARSTNRGMIEPSDSIVGVEIISALTAALTIAAGKVIFTWIPRVEFFEENIKIFKSRICSKDGKTPVYIQMTIKTIGDTAYIQREIIDPDPSILPSIYNDAGIIQNGNYFINNMEDVWVVPFDRYNHHHLAEQSFSYHCFCHDGLSVDVDKTCTLQGHVCDGNCTTCCDMVEYPSAIRNIGSLGGGVLLQAKNVVDTYTSRIDINTCKAMNILVKNRTAFVELYDMDPNSSISATLYNITDLPLKDSGVIIPTKGNYIAIGFNGKEYDLAVGSSCGLCCDCNAMGSDPSGTNCVPRTNSNNTARCPQDACGIPPACCNGSFSIVGNGGNYGGGTLSVMGGCVILEIDNVVFKSIQ